MVICEGELGNCILVLVLMLVLVLALSPIAVGCGVAGVGAGAVDAFRWCGLRLVGQLSVRVGCHA